MPADDPRDPREPWVAIEVRTAHHNVDALSGELWAAGVAGIEELEVERDGDVIVRAMVPDDAPSGPGAAGGDHGRVDSVMRVAERWGPVSAHTVDADEGLDDWRPWAAPVRVGDVTVIPAWWDGPVDDAPTVVRIDAGRVFGSGSHQSTQMALTLLQRHLEPGMSVIDVGCGSGVLSIAAVLLGARHVVALDIDPQAIITLERNADHNVDHDGVGVGGRIEASTTSVENVDARFDLIVANISAVVLAELSAPLVARRDVNARRSSVLILSGFLDEQESIVRAAFEPLEAIDRLERDEWRALALH